ncbi:MAG: CvpA family protein [Rickettsiales bacterium]|nr:CvpA family protein [Rickettsiales bacterium]
MDFIFIAMVAASAVFGYSGGFIAGVLSVVSWIAAALLAKAFSPMAEPMFAGVFGHSAMLVSIASYISVFVIVIMLLSFIGHWSGTRLRETSFDGIDKSLGFLFGIMRGILLMAAVYIGILWFMPNPAERPDWVQQAKSKPVLRSSALFVAMLLPDDGAFKPVHELVHSNISESELKFESLNRPDVAPLEDATSADEDGYKASEVRDLERQLKQLESMESEFLKE